MSKPFCNAFKSCKQNQRQAHNIHLINKRCGTNLNHPFIPHYAYLLKRVFCAKQTPEGSYSFVAQGSQCPVRAFVNPGNILNGICTPERGTSRHMKLKYPFQGYMFSAITPRVNNALSGHCEPWATAEKPLSGVCFAQSRA